MVRTRRAFTSHGKSST